jgi:hypothetical protein
MQARIKSCGYSKSRRQIHWPSAFREIYSQALPANQRVEVLQLTDRNFSGFIRT